MSKEKLTSVKEIFIMIVLVVLFFSVVGFTIYISSPDEVEINQIMYAGKETMKNNNKLAFDLIAWAPGYTDQAIIQIDNNTTEDLDYNIKFSLPEDIDENLLNSVGIYIKQDPSSRDVLKYYDSIITDGYTYIGTLSELEDGLIKSGVINNEHVDYSILLHVDETAEFEEIEYVFENVLSIETNKMMKNFE